MAANSSSDLKRTGLQAVTDLEHETAKKLVVESLRNKRALVAAMEMKAAENGAVSVEESCRERLKRHRGEMAARRVRIPETWGQEVLLRDWKVEYCTSISSSLFPAGLLLAREALIEESRRANPGRVLLGNSCI